MSLLNRSRNGAAVDVGAMLDATAAEYIASLVASGALVSLYRTRDAGALGCSVVYEGTPEKDYFRTPEELADWLRDVDQAVTALGPSSVKRPRKGA